MRFRDSARLLVMVLWLVARFLRAEDSPAAGTNGATLHRLEAGTAEGLRELFRPTTEPLPFVSAHRGGPQAGWPENCLATFEHTLRHTFAIIEVDPRYTKDGEIVLHHDAALERTTTGQGKVADFALHELRQLRLKDPDGKVTDYQMPTLDEALAWARGRTILVLDQKDVPAVERVRIVTTQRAEHCAILIVYSFADAQACHRLNPEIMLEVMIPNVAQAEKFEALGIPWSRVVAFVGHNPPEDPAIYQYIHDKGASCLIGTSRHLDRRVITRQVAVIEELEADYRALLRRGADLVETDIPTLLGPLLNGRRPVPAGKRPYLDAPGGFNGEKRH